MTMGSDGDYTPVLGGSPPPKDFFRTIKPPSDELGRLIYWLICLHSETLSEQDKKEILDLIYDKLNISLPKAFQSKFL